MKKKLLAAFTALLLLFFLFSGPAAADDPLMDHPSLYSFAEIVQKLPGIMTSTPAELMKVTSQYPDHICWWTYDIVGCQSVNNRYSAEISVNYKFSSEADDAELEKITFMMSVDSQADVQKVMELFWIPGMKPANITGAKYPDGEVTMYFSTDEILQTYMISFNTEGKPWLIMVEIGMIRG